MQLKEFATVEHRPQTAGKMQHLLLLNTVFLTICHPLKIIVITVGWLPAPFFGKKEFLICSKV